MTLTYVLMQNLKRNPLRSSLTAAAFALPMAVFTAAISLLVAMEELARENQRQLRLAVHHKTSISNMLPAGMRSKIQALDPGGQRITAICGMRWFGGRAPNTQDMLHAMAGDADTFPTTYSTIGMTPTEIDAWRRERRAALVGQATAAKYGWKLGDRIVAESTTPPYLALEFKIIKLLTDPANTNFFYFRLDYLDEALKAVGSRESEVNIFWVKCSSAEALRSLQREIDLEFANSPNETRSEDENAFLAGFIQAAGDIPALMEAMAVVVVLIISLVGGNTMMMSFRERVRELAVFKAIGFQARRVFFVVLAESLLLAVIGSVAGIAPTMAFLAAGPEWTRNLSSVGSLKPSSLAAMGSLGIALVVGAVAGLWPAYQAMRLKTVDALRRVA
ncbi:MAG: ABC transporter permease [Phycisphaerae bacterium]|nr:ABC transporter permease [Phycisphaerae bacterium]